MKTMCMALIALVLALSLALTGCDKNDGMIADVTSAPAAPAATVAAPENTAPAATVPAATEAPDANGILATEPPASAAE